MIKACVFIVTLAFALAISDAMSANAFAQIKSGTNFTDSGKVFA
jgi:hypothetical protein